MRGERFAGEWMDGQTALARPVTVGLEIGGLRFDDGASGAPLGLWPLAGLVIERLDHGAFHLASRSAPGALISSHDSGLLAALHAAGVGSRGVPAGGRRLKPALVYIGASLAVVAAVYASLPTLSAAIARRIPLEIEARMAPAAELLFGGKVCRSPAADRALAKLGQALAGAPPAVRLASLDVVALPTVNAFTLPGGKIVVTRALIDKAESADELAGVLAHEIEHVSQRHVMTHIVRSSMLSFGWMATVGDFSGMFVLDPETMFQLVNQGFSREDERAADAGAVRRLAAVGISPAGLAAFFRRLRAGDQLGLPAWLTTHPDTGERIAEIEKYPARPGTAPLLSAEEWQALRAACPSSTR